MSKQTKIIGLIGGMSWESSRAYYEHLNLLVRERLGGSHSAKIVLSSVDFAEIESLTFAGDWESIGKIMAMHARKLELAGAGMVLLCTNTIHLVYRAIEDAIEIPFIHIADTTGLAISEHGVGKVGLLGTKFTMEMDFYTDILKSRYHLDVLIPPQEDRLVIHDIIYDELVQGVFSESSALHCARLIRDLQQRGAEGVILGCTELPLLMNNHSFNIPLFDTTRLHAQHAIDLALNIKKQRATG
jgi:aspartate racemase